MRLTFASLPSNLVLAGRKQGHSFDLVATQKIKGDSGKW